MIEIEKIKGESMTDVIERARKENNIDEEIKITFAGRLDPLVSGAAILLVGEEVHKKEEYLKRDKEYRVEVLLGISTDTDDVLGRVTKYAPGIYNEEEIKRAVYSNVGEYEIPYPIYSSKPVDGKPLWMWARDGVEIDSEKMPKTKSNIKNISIDLIETKDTEAIKKEILENIATVKGDFRQQEIKDRWNEVLTEEKMFQIITITVHCTSGTYMRSLARQIGETLGIPALAYNIHRTKIFKEKL